MTMMMMVWGRKPPDAEVTDDADTFAVVVAAVHALVVLLLQSLSVSSPPEATSTTVMRFRRTICDLEKEG